MKLMDIRLRKSEIRKEINEKLREQPSYLRDKRSAEIQKKLVSSDEFKKARSLMTYMALPTEVKTDLVNKLALENGKKLMIPVIDDGGFIIAAEIKSVTGLVNGPCGILRPSGPPVKTPLKEIDLVIVPAIAYDDKNTRLGRGKGYYDKFLSSPDIKDAVTIGLAFHFQIVDYLPSDSRDIPVSKVITD